MYLSFSILLLALPAQAVLWLIKLVGLLILIVRLLRSLLWFVVRYKSEFHKVWHTVVNDHVSRDLFLFIIIIIIIDSLFMYLLFKCWLCLNCLLMLVLIINY